MTQSLTFAILTGGSRTAQELRNSLAADRRVRVVAESDNPEQVYAAVVQRRPSAVVITLGAQPEQAWALCRQINAVCPETVIICAVRHSSSDLILDSLRSGAREFLRLPINSEELRTVLDRTVEFCAGQSQSSKKRGRVIAVFSNKGGCGVSFIAANLAIAMGAPTVLADLNLQAGGIELFFGLKPKFSIDNALSAFIPEDERIVTIEDSAELLLQQPHVVRMETRPNNIEGRGEITQRDLVKNALRMRPDRIVIGEVRGGEAIDMLQAMNTGHDGSLTTIHANTPRDSLSRIETMIQMSGLRLSESAMRQQIASAINLVIQVARMSDGTRRITSILEITGMKRKEIAVQEVYRYERQGVDGDGRVIGRFRPTGVVPRFLEQLEVCGLTLPGDLFEVKEGQ